MKFFKLVALFLLIAACSSSTLVLSERQIERLSNSICVISITDEDLNVISTGSGWFAQNSDRNVRIYTAHHVVEDAITDGKLIVIGMYDIKERSVVHRYLGEVTGYEPDPVDLASVKITKTIDFDSLRRFQDISQNDVNRRHSRDCLRIELKNRPREMEQVFVVGFPGRGLTGRVLQYHRAEVSGYTGKEGYMLLNVMGSFSGGVSGGPILDRKGRTVLGIAHAVTRADRGPAHLVVPSTFLDRLYNDESALLAYYSQREMTRRREQQETPARGEPVLIDTDRVLSSLFITNSTGIEISNLFIIPADTKQVGLDILGNKRFPNGGSITHKAWHPSRTNLFHIFAYAEGESEFFAPNVEITDEKPNILSLTQRHRGANIASFLEEPDKYSVVTFENTLNTSIAYLFVSSSESKYWGADILETELLGVNNSASFIILYKGKTNFDVHAIDSSSRSYQTVITLDGDTTYQIRITESMMRHQQ